MKVLVAVVYVISLFCQVYPAHASHVLGVHFTHDSKYVLSIGGEDMTTLQWRVVDPHATANQQMSNNQGNKV
jgi:hypothetical protein